MMRSRDEGAGVRAAIVSWRRAITFKRIGVNETANSCQILACDADGHSVRTLRISSFDMEGLPSLVTKMAVCVCVCVCDHLHTLHNHALAYRIPVVDV